MAVELVKTGVITAVSSYFAVVKVPIDNTDRKFTFSRKVLYIFGMKCEGRMLNILERDMEVNVAYKLDPIQNPIIIAVWLGNRPDNLQEDASCLQPIFDQLGRLIEVNDDHCILECDDFQGKVLVRKSVVYHEGFLLDEETGPVLEIGDSVSFDAVPLRNGLEVANYIATCAWLGAEPPVVNRFQLAASDQDGEESKENFQSRASRYAEGIVAVVPNDAVAFVDVDIDDVTGKVLLFRSCFKSDQSVASRSVKDLVAAGDVLGLRVRRGWLYSGHRLWFATKAWKCCVEVSANTEETCDQTVANTSGVGIEAVDVLRASHANYSGSSIHRITVNNLPKLTVSSNVLFNDPPLCGWISRLSSDSASILFMHFKIYVNISDVYVDGSVCTLDQFNELVSSGKHVKFDAVRSDNAIRQKYGTPYSACCAWIGEKPSLAVITSALEPPDLSLLEDENRTFIGQVVKFCLPKMALIRLKREKTIVRLAVSGFLETPGELAVPNATIADFVNIGDYLEFKLRPWGKWLTAVESRRSTKKALKELMKINAEVRNDSNTTVKLSTTVSKVQNSASVNSSKLASKNVAPLFVKHKQTTLTGCESITRFPFKRNPVFTGCRRLLHCYGTLTNAPVKIKDGDFVNCYVVENAFGSSSFIDAAPVIYGHNDDKPITSTTISPCSKLGIWFDAVVIDDAGEKLRFQVERMWLERNGRQPPETCLRNELFSKGEIMLVPSWLHRGTVKSIPLYDCAIVIVREVPVLVTIQSLHTYQMVNQSYTSIDLFLKVGDEVLVSVVKEADYYRAEKCWSLCAEKTARTNNENESSSDAVNLLLIKSWTSDDYYAKAIVKRMETRYCVEFTTPKRRKLTKTLILDLFAGDKVFVDGKFISLDVADSLIGREMSFYVAFSLEEEKKGKAPYGLYVAYAWAGDGPLPWAALDDRFSVPKGVCHWNWVFEAVVECSPVTSNQRGVPQHIVCSIGPLPVLVPYNIADDAQNTCKRGERVCVRVLEHTHGTKTALVTNGFEKNMISFAHVLRLKGIVETLPKPVGIIKTIGDVKVSFELCHVQDEADFGCDGQELSAWFRRVSMATCVGETVYFTAVKVNGKTAPYRALEVWPFKK